MSAQVAEAGSHGVAWACATGCNMRQLRESCARLTAEVDDDAMQAYDPVVTMCS